MELAVWVIKPSKRSHGSNEKWLKYPQSFELRERSESEVCSLATSGQLVERNLGIDSH